MFKYCLQNPITRPVSGFRDSSLNQFIKDVFKRLEIKKLQNPILESSTKTMPYRLYQNSYSEFEFKTFSSGP